jgi:uncharacterized membrane protein YphA (DoxX/SURF4 family)
MLAATIVVTWPLWGDRLTPPRLPLVDLHLPHMGVPLIATAAVFVIWPRVGIGLNVLVGVAAMVDDQTRMQPQLFSFWLLMLGTLPRAAPRWLARCHLSSLWFFSGFHKLLSSAYHRDVAPMLWRGAFPETAWPMLASGVSWFGMLSVICEMGLGLAVWIPPLRRLAAIGGCLLHLSVVWMLHRNDNWNTSVWPWNLALAATAPALLATWRDTLVVERRICGKLAWAAGLALFVSPLLFYAGLLDAYLSHCLYSANVPTAIFFDSERRTAYLTNGIDGPYWKNLNVPQPPAHRLFEAYFRAVAKPGDRMEIEDGRAVAAWTRTDHYAWLRTDIGIEHVTLPPFIAK